MSLSESEGEILERLEQDFNEARPRALPQRVNSFSLRPVLATLVLLVSLFAVFVGLLLDNVGGVVLATIAYVAMVASAAAIKEAVSRARTASAREGRTRPASPIRRLFE